MVDELLAPLSSMLSADSTSVTVGETSSSVRVNDAPVTVPTPWVFCAVPVTVVVRFGSSWVLSTAVIVTVSLLFEVLPAGMVMVVSAPTV